MTLPPAHAAVQCSVKYSIDGSWQGGFQGGVKLTNSGDAVSSWTVGWSFANGQKINQGWGGTFSQSGTSIQVKNLEYNGAIPSGGTASFGFLGTWTGSNSVPTSFTLNGTPCDGGPSDNKVPTVKLTSPTAGATYDAPGTVPLAATASDSDGTVAKVEFYSDTELIGSDTTSPYTATWSDVPAGSYSITAKAIDDRGGTASSSPVGIQVTSGPTVKVSPPTRASLWARRPTSRSHCRRHRRPTSP